MFLTNLVATADRWRAGMLGLIGLISLALGAYTSWTTGELLPVLAGATIIPSLWLAERAIGLTDMRRQTISSFWFLTYLVMIFWPAFLVYADQEGPHRDAFLFSAASALVMVPAGVLLALRLTGSSRAERDAFFTRPLPRPGTAMFVVCVAIAVAIVGSIALYFTMLTEIPLLYVLRYPGCDLVLAQLREETFKLLDPRWNAEAATPLFYLFLPLRTIIDPFVVAALFAAWVVTRERRWFWLFIVVFVAATLYAASSLARAPTAALVLRMFFVFYILRAGLVGWRSAALWAAAVVAFPLLVTSAAYRPGPPPADCGPAAARVPEIAAIVLIDPYRALEVAPPHATPGPLSTAPVAVPTVPPAGPGAVQATAAPPAPVTAPPRVHPVSGLGDAAGQVVRRLSYTEAFALYTYFRVFPAEHDWLWGQTLLKPLFRLWGGDFYVENFVYQRTYPTSPIPTGHLNAAFQSNFYADFGLPGVLGGGLITGAVMGLIEVYLWRRRKTFLELATFAVLVYAFWVLHSGSLTSVLISNGALLVLIIPPAMRFGERILVRVRSR